MKNFMNAAVYTGQRTFETTNPRADRPPGGEWEVRVEAGLSSAAVEHPLRHSAVVSAVIGMRTVAHVDSSIERRASPIPDELWAEFDESALTPGLIGAEA